MNNIMAVLTSFQLILLSAGTASADFEPEVIDFSKGFDFYEQELESHCSSITVQKFDPPQLPGTTKEHLQLNCAGFSFAGKSRLAEFVFRDGALALVWILTSREEEAELIAELGQRYGAPSHANASFTAFTAHRAALRKDVPEVLFYSPMMAAMFENWFGQQSQ